MPGAASVTGINHFRTTRPDGYTLLHFGMASTVRAARGGVPFRATDFAPIANQVMDPNYLLVRADSPFRTIGDLLDAAITRPVTIANAGIGGGHHTAALLFQEFTGVRVTHVPYEGGGPAVVGLLAGHVDASMNVPVEGLSHVDAGTLRILAIFSDRRSGVFPNVLTAKEQHVDLSVTQWRGVVTHKEVPEVIRTRLMDIFEQIANDPDYQARLRGLRFGFKHIEGEEFGRLIESEAVRFRRLMEKHGLVN
jgi:tripartite-type tricarboxylate transporter receptor subunit TctC